MSTLVIASNEDDYKYLKSHDLLTDIKDSFNADKIRWCDKEDCLKGLSQVVDYILYFDSFKHLTYEQVRALAAASLTVDQVYGVQLKDDKLWLYDDGIIIDCIQKKGIADAISKSIDFTNKIIEKGDAVMAIIVAIIFTVLLVSYISTTTQPTVYAQPQQETQQEIDK